ncbi:FMN-binding glutamate synthase family protein [Agaribacter marinus]|uniref:FMN-binding glutamate synthase family protein n=1 Tax=Agaribacter marinus TaxID=1431249 RepID=A0AA37SX63_9ALTE|nr:FMN-binding glutamate synthase family protein [Agaribacter marinus]GLR69780.1 FMN-binding glutamate synthase family protein [Agaribacter marinus]
MNSLSGIGLQIIEWGALLFIFVLGCLLLLLVSLYIIDKTQTSQTVRRNFPVVGRFRYLFEHYGEFFRQYFFAMDREEMPFNRAERSWVYRAAKNVDSTVAFGSTRNLSPTGEILFVNCPFPTLSEDIAPTGNVAIGELYCETPYITSSIFNISGMSYGALSKPAVLALSKGAAKAGCWMNTGEGGCSPHHLEGGADLVVQIGTAKYGVRNEQGELCDHRLKELAAYPQVKMFEIKMSQGAKPGKGGILPGEKVSAEIAEIRGISVGQDSISPNGHPDIRNEGDLLDMISHIRKVTGKPVGFKTVVGAEHFFETLFDEINRRGVSAAPDFITIDSADGGTGAAPQSLMDYMGLPIRESLPWVVDKLNECNLRQRIKVIASGKMITPSGVAWAMSMGADFVVSARGFMFALGCIQALQCNKNTCPTGITTHNKKLQRGLVPKDKATRVADYAKNMNYEVGIIAHACGVKEPRELKRHHARVVSEDNGRSIPLSEKFPESNNHAV